MEPTEMNGDAFFARWKNLSIPGQEAQKIYKAVYPMDPTQVKTKLIGYGFSILEGIDPNPENYVCAGIIHTKTVQIGCLLRLEPNKSANVSIFGAKIQSLTSKKSLFTILKFEFKRENSKICLPFGNLILGATIESLITVLKID